MASLVEVLIQQEKRQVAHAMLHAFASRKKDWNRHKKAMALLFAKLGDVATAKDMLEKVVKAQETSQGSSLSHALLVNTETRLQIAQGFWRAGRTVSARSMLKHTLREIETMREQIPDESFAQALEAMIWPKLVALQTKFGNLQEAQHLLAQIPREFLKEEPLLTILGIRLQTGEIEKARETARHPAIIGFESVIRTQIRYGDVEGAQRSLEALEERIASNEGLQRHRAKYHIVEYPRDYHNAVWVVAKARMRIGEYPETLDWARNQSTTDLKAYALLGVAEGLLEKREIVH